MKNIFKLLTISFFATLTGCVNDDNYGVPESGCLDLTVTKNISDIVAAAGNNPAKYIDEEGDDILEAYVTSSDEGGNFYKSISMVSIDGTRGFTMPVNAYNLYTKYEPGRRVFVKLKDLYYAYTTLTSSYEIGDLYEGRIGRISMVEYEDAIKRSCDKVDEEQLVNPMTIAQAKNNNNLHKLIEFDNVQFTDASLGHTYFDASMNPSPTWTATNHTIRDASGNTIIVRISDFATFSKDTVASGNGKIRGILTKYNSDWQFMVRTEKDIKLDGERVVPVNPNQPTPPTNLLFNGSSFETWSNFTSSINSFGLKTYAVQGIGTGAIAGNSLHLNGTPTANDYVFTILASAKGTIPASPSTITFWVKGTSGKSLSLNVYRSTTGYDVFNVSNLGSNAVTLTKAALQTTGANAGSGTNSYTGTIDTGGQWVKVTLDISDVQLNTTNAGDIFALKVGSNAAYNLHIDNIEIH